MPDGSFIANECVFAYFAMLVKASLRDWEYDEGAVDVVLYDLILFGAETQHGKHGVRRWQPPPTQGGSFSEALIQLGGRIKMESPILNHL
jgi:hypothetical protein